MLAVYRLSALTQYMRLPNNRERCDCSEFAVAISIDTPANEIKAIYRNIRGGEIRKNEIFFLDNYKTAKRGQRKIDGPFRLLPCNRNEAKEGILSKLPHIFPNSLQLSLGIWFSSADIWKNVEHVLSIYQKLAVYYRPRCKSLKQSAKVIPEKGWPHGEQWRTYSCVYTLRYSNQLIIWHQ